jgi:hypothetical protein
MPDARVVADLWRELDVLQRIAQVGEERARTEAVRDRARDLGARLTELGARVEAYVDLRSGEFERDGGDFEGQVRRLREQVRGADAWTGLKALERVRAEAFDDAFLAQTDRVLLDVARDLETAGPTIGDPALENLVWIVAPGLRLERARVLELRETRSD